MGEPAAQNRTQTVGRPFEPGNRANPGGRPKGIARLARELTGGDGELVLRFYAAAMGGKMTNPDFDQRRPASETNPEFVVVSERGRLEAARLLTERGFGKAPAFAPMEEGDPLELSDREAEVAAAALDARLDEVAERRNLREAQASASG